MKRFEVLREAVFVLWLADMITTSNYCAIMQKIRDMEGGDKDA